MIRLKPIRKNKWGDAIMTIEVQGWYDIYRFARNLEEDQVEFADIGMTAIQRMHKDIGSKEFWHMMRHFHGDGRMDGEPTAEQRADIRMRAGYFPRPKHRSY